MFLVECVFIAYFAYVVLYSLIFSIASRFYSFHPPELNQKNRICVLIPSYREDNIIIETAKQALVQSYNKDYYDVIVIADSLKPETIKELKTLPISVHEVSFEKSTKVKALNSALSQLKTEYQFAVILDADNHMKFDFLERLNSVITPGQVIQGQRKAKNSDNTLSFLDGLSEAINTSIFRKGHYTLHLSSSISGSGVIFPFNILKEKLSTMESIGGFDRELELRLIEDGIKVSYYEDAIVYDEKVSSNATFQNQRKRWISSQYYYLARYFKPGIKSLFGGDFTFFNSAVLRNVQLPRLINLGLLTTLTLLSILTPYFHFSNILWIGLFAVNTLAIGMAIPKEFWTFRLVTSIFSLPLIFLQMLMLLFRLKGANKKFIHTPHGVNSNGTN